MLNWVFWAIPKQYVRQYFIILWLILFVMPGLLFGMRLTMLGILVNIIWYDFCFYGWIKFKEAMERYK